MSTVIRVQDTPKRMLYNKSPQTVKMATFKPSCQDKHSVNACLSYSNDICKL